MKTFDELKVFIELKATEYEAIDEGENYENLWQCEMIDTAVFKEIAIFALNEGLVLEGVDLAFYVENFSNPVPDEADEDEWYDMMTGLENDVRDAMWELAEQKKLPERTQRLYDLWQRSFYPKFYGEDS